MRTLLEEMNEHWHRFVDRRRERRLFLQDLPEKEDGNRSDLSLDDEHHRAKTTTTTNTNERPTVRTTMEYSTQSKRRERERD